MPRHFMSHGSVIPPSVAMNTPRAVDTVERYWDPLNTPAGLELSNENRLLSYVGPETPGFAMGAIGNGDGKFYLEVVFPAADSCGICLSTADPVLGYIGDVNSIGCWAGNSEVYENDVLAGTIGAINPGDVIGVCLDIDGAIIYFAINNVWQNGSDPEAGTGGFAYSVEGTLHPAGSPGGTNLELRTTSADFTYSIPTGYTAWAGS